VKTSSIEILEKALLPPAQAHAILKVMEVEMAYSQETVATKVDLLAMRGDFLTMRADLKADFMVLAAEFRALEARIDARIDGKIGVAEGRLTRCVFTCILGQTAVFAGLGYFFLVHFGR
jgi:hypothetical protein